MLLQTSALLLALSACSCKRLSSPSVTRKTTGCASVKSVKYLPKISQLVVLLEMPQGGRTALFTGQHSYEKFGLRGEMSLLFIPSVG